MTFLFLIGTGRCGSTLVQQALCGHPHIGFVARADDRLRRLGTLGRHNNRLYRRMGSPLDRSPRTGLRGKLPSLGKYSQPYAPAEAYAVLNRNVSRMISTPCRDLTARDATPWMAERFRTFFEERAEAQGQPVFLHKFTGWNRARFVDAILPEAKFVHIVRDGRAVANSLLHESWWHGYRGPTEWSFGPLPEAYDALWQSHGRSFVVLAGLEWKILMDAAEEAKAAIPSDRWHEIRYEDFVAEPRSHMQGILDFAGLGWNDEFERMVSSYSISPGRQDAYRRELGDEDVADLNEVLGADLERYGYEL